MPTTPLYQLVIDDIRQQIIAGTLRPGDKLPTVKELKQIHGVGSTAIRNAMLLLQSQGILVGQQGKGVYVATDARKLVAGQAG